MSGLFKRKEKRKKEGEMEMAATCSVALLDPLAPPATAAAASSEPRSEMDDEARELQEFTEAFKVSTYPHALPSFRLSRL